MTIAEAARGWLQMAGLNRAAAFAIAGRFWQFLAGPVTVLLIVDRFSSETQGWYYTLTSLLAAQTLFDMGLANTIVHAASHAWARLHCGPGLQLQGDAAALQEVAAIRQGGRRWFAGVAIAFAVGAGVGGTLFLSSTATQVAWQWPWISAVLCAAGTLWLTPDLAILEGCGQVTAVHRLRLWLAMLGNAVVWLGLYAGALLWIVAIAAGVRVLGELWLVLWAYRRFWKDLPQTVATNDPLWGQVVWPLQWRAAVHSVLIYIAYQLFVPVLFRLHGPVVAGRFGMTWSILVTLQSAAGAWVQTRASEFGVLVRQRDFERLDRLYRRVTTASFLVLLTGVCGLWLCVAALGLGAVDPNDPATLTGWPWFTTRLQQRLLTFTPTLLLGLGVLAMHYPQCQTLYLRSFLRDPLLRPALVLNGCMAVATISGAYYASATGLAWAYLVVTAGGILPVWTLLWRHYRRVWQAEFAAAEATTADVTTTAQSESAANNS